MRRVFTLICSCLSVTALLAPPAYAAGVDAVVEWSRRVELRSDLRCDHTRLRGYR